MTTETRLAKVEKRLTARQCVLAYLDEIMRRFGTWSAWLESDMPVSEAPLIKPARAARAAAQSVAIASTKGLSGEAYARAGVDADFDVFFLMHLFMDVTSRLLADMHGYDLRAALCVRSLYLLHVQDAMSRDARDAIDYLREAVTQEEKAGKDMVPAKALCKRLGAHLVNDSCRVGGKESPPPEAKDAKVERSKGSAPDRYGRLLDRFREDIRELCAEVYLHRDMIEAIRNNFFDGRPILFPDTANRLEKTIDLAEMLVERYNDFAWDAWELAKAEATNAGTPGTDGSPPEGLVIELPAVKDTTAIRQNVTFIVRMAKAAALANMDRNAEGWRLAREAYMKRPQDGKNDNG